MQVSIIVPVYNVEKYIIECLNSAIVQGLDSYEIICVDDCGTDNSVELINEFIKENNLYDIVRLIKHEKNGGLSAARNTGIAVAKGEYIFFLDSDDILEKNSLSEMYHIACSKNLDILESGFNEFFETDYNIEVGKKENIKEIEPMKGAEYLTYVLKNKSYIPMAWGKLYRTELVKSVGGFYRSLISEDEEFTPRIFVNARAIGRCCVMSYLYRRRDSSITTSYQNNVKWVDSYVIIIKKMYELEKKYNLSKTERYYIEQHAAQITLSLLKNAAAYQVSSEVLEYILKVIKDNKLRMVAIKSHFFREKLEGLLFLFPKIYIFLYRRIKNVRKN